MCPDSANRKQMGQLFALSQVGLEMVVPIVLGVYLDDKFGWAPWGVVGGAVLGLAGGLFHLIYLSNRIEPPRPPDSSGPPEESP